MGLCAFVPEGDERLRVIFVDAHDDRGEENPPHSAAMALFRLDKHGRLRDPVAKALSGEELVVKTDGATTGSVSLDSSHLVDMEKASGGAPNGVIHADTLKKDRRILGRLDLQNRALGGSLTTDPQQPSGHYLFRYGDSIPDYCVDVVGEIRLSMDLPASTTTRLISRSLNGSNELWNTDVLAPNDSAATLVLSNLPVHQPFDAGGEPQDHHFTRYYALARKEVDKEYVPMTGKGRCPDSKGGAIPRCAMALFKAS